MKTDRACGGKLTYAGVVLSLALCLPSYAGATVSLFGNVVQVEQLSFHPDAVHLPGDNFAVLVIQNREDAPIQHEVTSPQLFESGTLIQVQGTGRIEYNGKRVSRVVLNPGEEVVIWFYAVKGITYQFQCNLNGHAMVGMVRAS
ncbi:MAG: hypothetical protein EPO02_08250 [Nitrospirae bacterium]|nr:MAG: hypothetical protein EPO02_08250 [Nitrospirota bacterium]